MSWWKLHSPHSLLGKLCCAVSLSQEHFMSAELSQPRDILRRLPKNGCRQLDERETVAVGERRERGNRQKRACSLQKIVGNAQAYVSTTSYG